MWIVIYWVLKAVQSCEYRHFGETFRLTSVLKVEAICCSETLVILKIADSGSVDRRSRARSSRLWPHCLRQSVKN